ncbi:hypothetical protein [Burkholderia sp. Bp8986]|uniref:hypothetical protein n=1 Tax=Burkholderia sp. Bp8986 TaxID=2184550 RepID=UPI000F594235|nr:hypothetical protein [Burkholderia sp. Bp8986]
MLPRSISSSSASAASTSTNSSRTGSMQAAGNKYSLQSQENRGPSSFFTGLSHIFRNFSHSSSEVVQQNPLVQKFTYMLAENWQLPVKDQDDTLTMIATQIRQLPENFRYEAFTQTLAQISQLPVEHRSTPLAALASRIEYLPDDNRDQAITSIRSEIGQLSAEQRNTLQTVLDEQVYTRNLDKEIADAQSKAAESQDGAIPHREAPQFNNMTESGEFRVSEANRRWEDGDKKEYLKSNKKNNPDKNFKISDKPSIGTTYGASNYERSDSIADPLKKTPKPLKKPPKIGDE